MLNVLVFTNNRLRTVYMKKLIILSFVLFGVLFVWMFYSGASNSENQKTIKSSRQQPEVKMVVPMPSKKQQLIPAQQKDDIVFTDKDISEIERWNSKSIHHSSFTGSDYDTYDEKILVNLINGGDVMAMKALWSRYLHSGNPELLEKQYELVERAIIYGDREMFQYMQANAKLTTSLGNPDLTEDQRKAVALEYLALTEFMGMRGQLEDKYQAQKSLFRLYPEIYSNTGSELTLTENDKLKIKSEAKNIYQYYENARKELGLGEFDNSVPQGVQKNFERQKADYLKALGDNSI
jgi:hypothetical protein